MHPEATRFLPLPSFGVEAVFVQDLPCFLESAAVAFGDVCTLADDFF